ncbi:MBL fold metallo-hydrolase [Nonlabens xiamenensis]|uniref:MBL fold metallo-hydrolase n=1 Tax=Nonlabens xiamenensis TaxID=2341043 RepID=UPI000F613E0A|nr:MBL fold metallo-hydrolase [Nonlabens xiamenensis]
MKKQFILLVLMAGVLFSCKDKESDQTMETKVEVEEETTEVEMPNITITPISHATFVMDWDGQIIYVDPVGGATAFEGMPEPEVILVTDIHGDHMNKETLQALKNESNFLFAPEAVTSQLPDELKPTVTVANGETATRESLKITAIPMYNITEGRLQFHEKGRGNGYVLEKDGYRIYISGDTEHIPEMNDLKNINKAFLCMNLPYTMDIDQATNAVLSFTPDEVIPYHYRGQDGFQDVEKFKEMVNGVNQNIEVTLMDWYPEKKSDS